MLFLEINTSNNARKKDKEIKYKDGFEEKEKTKMITWKTYSKEENQSTKGSGNKNYNRRKYENKEIRD